MNLGSSFSISFSKSSLSFESRIAEINNKLFETEKGIRERFLNIILGLVTSGFSLEKFKAIYDGKADKFLAEYSKYLDALASDRSQNISQLSQLSSFKNKLFNEKVFMLGLLKHYGHKDISQDQVKSFII